MKANTLGFRFSMEALVGVVPALNVLYESGRCSISFFIFGSSSESDKIGFLIFQFMIIDYQ